MSDIKGYRVINGKWGRVWIDGELYAEINSFDAKITINREEVSFIGQMGQDSKMTGWSGAGTINIKKVYSRIQNKIAAKIKRGEDVRVQVVAALEDPDAYGYQRVQLDNVWLNELTLGSFEDKNVLNEDVPFGFSDFEMLEAI